MMKGPQFHVKLFPEQCVPNERGFFFVTHTDVAFSSKSSRSLVSHGIVPESEQSSHNEIPF